MRGSDMTSTLAGAFRASFRAIVIAFGLAVLAGSAGYVMAGGNALLAVVFAGLGLAAVVALFGLVALQIENTELLARIAAAVEAGGAGRAGAGSAEDRATSAEVGAPVRVSAMAPPPLPARRAAASQGRVEPVVTLRRGGS